MENIMASEKQQLINPPGTETVYERMQFSQAVRVGDTLWVSGQTGVDENWKAADGIENQAQLAFQGLERIIKEAGGTLADIVELVTYHTSMKDIRGFSKVKAKFISAEFPAWTAVGVTELVMPDLLVEVRATVVIGSGKG
jgi:enamine deaminase RidA (YjgF/YER057c/UK114 family)